MNSFIPVSYTHLEEDGRGGVGVRLFHCHVDLGADAHGEDGVGGVGVVACLLYTSQPKARAAARTVAPCSTMYSPSSSARCSGSPFMTAPSRQSVLVPEYVTRRAAIPPGACLLAESGYTESGHENRGAVRLRSVSYTHLLARRQSFAECQSLPSLGEVARRQP